MTDRFHSRNGHPGPERELLKLLAHGDPEVRGLTALLVGKLSGRMPIAPSVFDAVRGLLEDEDKRVQASATKAMLALEREKQKNAARAPDEKLIVAHGNYRELESYRASEILYEGTVAFCNRFIGLRSRTHDQMVQAARSGKQNIVEGCMASGTSKKMELKLVGVARASLEELLQDFEDYLRHHRLEIWGKDHPKAVAVRRLAYKEDRSYRTYAPYLEAESPEIAANTLLCLTHQTNYLLDRQLKALEAAFVDGGGFSERLYRVRAVRREGQKGAQA